MATAVIRMTESDDGAWYCHVIHSDAHRHDTYDEALSHIRDLSAACPSAAVFVPPRPAVAVMAG